MSDQFKDGGQVTPALYVETQGEASRVIPEGGLSLRDWFAGQALAGASTAEYGRAMNVANEAYRLADAMLAVREGGTK